MVLAIVAGFNAAEARAQLGSKVGLGLHLGLTSLGADYQSACRHAHLAYGVSMRSSGSWYVTGGISRYTAGFGEDLACTWDSVDEMTSTLTTGGLDMEAASRVGVGGGHVFEVGPVVMGAELGAGLMRGRPGYERRRADEARASARVVPWLGGALRFRPVRWLELTWERGAARLPFRKETYPGTGGPPPAGLEPLTVREYHTWEALSTVTIGLRW